MVAFQTTVQSNRNSKGLPSDGLKGKVQLVDQLLLKTHHKTVYTRRVMIDFAHISNVCLD